MAARSGRRRRGAEEHVDDERWLLTYADMITLLMALFMVLFSISSVNTTKFEVLQKVLKEAFSGKILPGGESFQQSGGTSDVKQAAFEPPLPSIQPVVSESQQEEARAEREQREQKREKERQSAAKREEDEFKELKRRIDAYASRRGLTRHVETVIKRRGLVIRLLTDRVLFDSGEAALKPGSRSMLAEISKLVRVDKRHPVSVEGHTDNVPINTAHFPSNWELSGARASSVVRFLLRSGVRARRLEATGVAHLHPIASNASATGRSRNRRVEIVLLRLNEAGQEGQP